MRLLFSMARKFGVPHFPPRERHIFYSHTSERLSLKLFHTLSLQECPFVKEIVPVRVLFPFFQHDTASYSQRWPFTAVNAPLPTRPSLWSADTRPQHDSCCWFLTRPVPTRLLLRSVVAQRMALMHCWPLYRVLQYKRALLFTSHTQPWPCNCCMVSAPSHTINCTSMSLLQLSHSRMTPTASLSRKNVHFFSSLMVACIFFLDRINIS